MHFIPAIFSIFLSLPPISLEGAARNLSCAIDTNTLSTTEALSQNYFLNHASEFYQINSSLPEKLQFIDEYSKVLHSYGDHKIYTIPYDDELGQSGALTVSLEIIQT